MSPQNHAPEAGAFCRDLSLGTTVWRVLQRILITVVVTLTVIFVGVNWIAPVARSFYL